MLIYSDGATEIDLAGHLQLSSADFASLYVHLAGPPNRSLDELITELRALTPTGSFEDDCSLIEMTFL
jgi:serine phosphatase RsbU (regulator of sigma subunit)